MNEIIFLVLALVTLAVNITTTMFALQRKKGLPFTLLIFSIFTVFWAFSILLSDTLSQNYSGLRGFFYLPLVLWLFEGLFFQKLFSFAMMFLLTMLQASFAELITRLFVPYGSGEYVILVFGLTVVMYAIYLFVIIKYARRLFAKLFIQGRNAEWALYSLGALLSFFVLMYLRRDPTLDPGLYFVLLVFIVWSFSMLCFAIINTHEKAKQQYEAEFARNIIFTGQEHYHRMEEMLDKIRILRHDYKYHLMATSELLHSGNAEEIDKYLNKIATQLSKQELPHYCSNPIINSLLLSYAERCNGLDITYTVEISLPKELSTQNYEMCIIVGNLLENAVDACMKIDSGRKIHLTIKPQGAQIAIMVKNSFDGLIHRDESGQLMSLKQDGGIGLQSVQAIIQQKGELVTEWNEGEFTSYVLINM